MKSRQDQSATVKAKASLFGAFAFVSVRLGPERFSRCRRQ
jgi:hypothetical protein